MVGSMVGERGAALALVCVVGLACGPSVTAIDADETGAQADTSSGSGPVALPGSSGAVDTTGGGTTAADETAGDEPTTTTGGGPEPACPDGGPTPQTRLLLLLQAVTGKEADGSHLAPGARDVDGDGLDDLVVATADRVWLLHGGFAPDAASVSEVVAGGGGFEVVGIVGETIRSVTILGDVTGDGLADIGVAAVDDTECDCRGGDFACEGSAIHRPYVVAGTSSTAPVSLLDVEDGIGGFAVVPDPEIASCSNRPEMRPAGDIDGDGIGDLIFSPGVHGGVVVPGKPDFEPLTWDKGTVFGHFEALHAAGDFDGDGLDDLVGREGNEVLVFRGTMGGPPTPAVTVLGANGANSPIALGVGDVNGDGLSDVAIQDVTLERFHILFGGAFTGTIATDDLAAGMGGFGITLDDDYVSRREIAAAGDVDGDGLDDLAVTDFTLSSPEVPRAYVVYGQAGTDPVDLCDAAVGQGGFGIVGTDEHPTDHIAGVGDLDGDGRAELRVQTTDGVYVVDAPR